MNGIEIRNRIAALQNRADSLNITAESKRGVQMISDVIDNHMIELDEIVESVKPAFMDKMLANLNDVIDDTEKTLAWHEAKWGTAITTIDDASPIVQFLRSVKWS